MNNQAVQFSHSVSPLMHARDADYAENTPPLHLPLADVQRGLWFVQQVAPDNAAYNLVFAARVISAIDEAAFVTAVQTLVNRHAALRTRIVMNGAGVPQQEVLSTVAADCVFIPAAGWSEETLRERAIAETKRPFDLARAPLLRVCLFQRAPRDALMVWTAQHIAVDFWSLAVLLDEFRQLYAGLAAGRAVNLPPVASDYPVYVQRQADMLASPAGTRLWQYWREVLSGDLPVLNLAGDYPRPPVQAYCGASLGFQLDAELTAALHGLARSEGVTLYVLLLAAYYALLHRYTGQDDILVGSPVAGRLHKDFRRTVGHFVNTIVLRGAVSGDSTFRELVRQTRDRVGDALRHQEYPFASLVEKRVTERDISRPPLFQAAFSWERLPQFQELASFFSLSDKPAQAVEFGGLSLLPFPLPQQEGQVDMALEMGGESDGELFGVWKYDSGLFAAETAAALARQFAELLRGIVADPAQTVARLPLLSGAERERVLMEWNRSGQALPAARTVHELVEQQVARSPDKTAVTGGEHTFSYRVLNQRANQLAHYMIESGVAAGQHIGICTSRSADMLVAMLAVLKTGATYVPLDPAFPRERLSMMMEDAAIALVLTHETVWQALALPAARALRLDRDWPEIATFAAHNPRRIIAPLSPAYVIYTSGSTGKPKGVAVPHGAVVNFLASMAREPGMSADDVMLAVTTLSFDIAVLELLLPLTVGAATVIASREVSSDAQRLEALIESSGATLMQATPATWRMLLSNGWQGNPRLSVLCGGEVLPRQLADALLPRVAALWNMYGPTETTVWSTLMRVEPGADAVAIGRPIANTQIYIVDEAMQLLPPGVPGELCIGGSGVALGYLNRPELTAEKFIVNPYASGTARLYKTGDLARWRRDGTLECLGRLDQQVKLRGFRIELGEIESQLCRHPSVRQAVVTVREDRPGDQRLAAYVVGINDNISAAALKAHLAETLPGYMLPSHIVALAEFPLTPNGKVNRRALPPPAEAAHGADSDFIAPRDRDEIQLAGLWEQLLGVHPVGVNQNFFDLGGHSLLAVQLVAGIRERFDVELPVSVLFQHNTVEALARLLREHSGEAAAATPLVPLRAGGDLPAFFFMHPIGGTVFCYLALTRHLDARRPVYAVQSPGLEDASLAEVSVPDLARRYLEIIRVQQPQGPYYLGGWCFGGLIAFEAARQLEAAGEKIAELVMFDTRAPIAENAPADADDATLLSWFARDLAVPYGKTLAITPEELRAVDGAGMFEYVLQRAREIEVLPHDADTARLYRYFEVYLANGIALQTYESGDYAGPMTLLRAADEPVDYGPLLGWDKVVSRPFTLAAVPGDHNSMMYESHVQALAYHVNETRSRAEPRPALAG
ncbi:MAG: amino acid adenylation domain-containing protein [Pseudomonadota bacterium]